MKKPIHLTLLVFFLFAFYANVFSAPVEETTLIAKAAERGSRSAQLLLGMAYRDGRDGLPQDDKLAAYWIGQAATQGHAYAQNQLGEFYAQGKGVKRDLAQAVVWWQKSARQGIEIAELHLGQAYLYGQGIARDYKQADYWLGKSADQGNAEAQFLLGKMYRIGYGIPQDSERGKNLLDRAAAQGNSDAIKLLDFMFEIGRDSLETYEQSGEELRKHAHTGNVEAQYQLALRYETGAWGVRQDNAKALYWFNQAAKNGHRLAMKSLVHIYEKGLPDVAPDSKLADQWRKKAEALKH